MAEENTNNTPPIYPTENPKVSKPRKTVPTFAGIAIIVVAALVIFGGVFLSQYFPMMERPVPPSNNFDTYLPRKAILSTFVSGDWGIFNADHTITLGWGLDYAGPNDDRPHSGVGNWSVDKDVLTITGPGGLAGEYDFSKLAKLNVGDKFIYADQYSALDDGRYVGVFIGDNFTTIGQKIGTNSFDRLDQVDSTITAQTAGWKTYTNAQYGFEFMYPKNWNVTINKHIKNPEQVGVYQVEVNFPPEKEISNYSFSQGYAVVVQIQNIKDLDSKNQDQLYKSQLEEAEKYGFNVSKFDFQGEKGVATYQYSPATASSGEGCMTSVAVFHGSYIFNMEPVFGDVILPKELGQCSNSKVLQVSDDFRKVISTFKFIK